MKSSALALISLFVAQQAAAQQPQPSMVVLAQALDRCMAMQAVRLTQTEATDADIFRQASQSCLSLNEALRAAVNAELSPADARAVLSAIDAQAEPNFMTMLSRIRSDRARRAGQ